MNFNIHFLFTEEGLSNILKYPCIKSYHVSRNYLKYPNTAFKYYSLELRKNFKKVLNAASLRENSFKQVAHDVNYHLIIIVKSFVNTPKVLKITPRHSELYYYHLIIIVKSFVNTLKVPRITPRHSNFILSSLAD